MKHVRRLAIPCAALLWGCDPVPDLYVVDASIEAGPADAGQADASGGFDAGDSPEGAADGGVEDAGPEAACVSISCPACPPNPGQCCSSGIPCLGANCAADCDAGCAGCNPGEMCCSKQGGQPLCRSVDSGKCPP